MKSMECLMSLISYIGMFVISMQLMWIFTSMDILEMIILAAIGSLVVYIPLGIKNDKQEKRKR